MSNHYYEVIRLVVNETGDYTLFTKSDIDTYGYIYKDTFDPKNPSKNIELENNDGCDQEQFKFDIQLDVNTTYILVVTTFDSNKTGTISVLILGPAHVIFKRICEYSENFVHPIYHRTNLLVIIIHNSPLCLQN